MNWLFDESSFFTRDHCGSGWENWFIATYMLANFTIAISYFIISLSLGWLYVKKAEAVPEPRGLVYLFIFLLFCGLTHLCDVTVFYYAGYRIYLVVDIITALVSFAAALAFPKMASVVSQMPSLVEYRSMIASRDEEIIKRKQAENDLLKQKMFLQHKVEELELNVAHLRFRKGLEEECNAIGGVLNDLRKIAH